MSGQRKIPINMNLIRIGKTGYVIIAKFHRGQRRALLGLFSCSQIVNRDTFENRNYKSTL